VTENKNMEASHKYQKSENNLSTIKSTYRVDMAESDHQYQYEYHLARPSSLSDYEDDRSKEMVDHGCAMPIISYMLFVLIGVSTTINIIQNININNNNNNDDNNNNNNNNQNMNGKRGFSNVVKPKDCHYQQTRKTMQTGRKISKVKKAKI